MLSHADFAIMQACVGLRNALKCISEAILPGCGAQLVIANRLEFCLFCMQVYNEFCWPPQEAVLLCPCVALLSIHVLAETEQSVISVQQC